METSAVARYRQQVKINGLGERRIEINHQTVADSFQEDAAHGAGKMGKQ